MTRTSEKLRALFLTAIMVVSVFGATVAFTGAAAAAPADEVAVSSVANNPVEHNGNIEIALNDTLDAADAVGAGDVEVYWNGTQLSNANINVVDDGTGGSITLTLGSGNDILPTESVIVNVTTLANADNHTVTLTGAAASNGNDLTGNAAVYNGTDVAIVTAQDDETIDIAQNGDRVRTRGTGANSNVYVFDSSNADPGDVWNFSTRNAGNLIQVGVQDLGLTISASSTSPTTDDTLEVTAEADDIGRDVEFRLVDSEGNVDDTFSANLGSNGQATYTNSSLKPNDFTVMVVDANSGISAETDTISVSDVEVTASFDQTIYQDNRGDVIEIPISMTEGRTVDVRLGSNSSGYNVSFSVTDGNEDGSVTVLFNTFHTTDSAAAALSVVTAGQPDDAHDTISGETGPIGSLTSPIAVGDYELSLSIGDEGEVGVAQVNVQERATESLGVHIAPGDTVDSRATALAMTTDAQTVSTHDDIVVKVDVSGLEGNYSAGTTLNGTGFDGLWLNVTETNPGQNADPILLNGQSDSVMIMGDTVNDSVWAVIDVSDAGFAPGDEVEVEFKLDGANSALLGATSDETVSGTFTVAEDKASFDSSPIVLRAADSQVVSGTTTRAPMQNITVNLRSPGNFLLSNTQVTVQEGGTWTTTYNLSDESEGTEFTATIASGFGVSADGRIAGAATVSMADQTTSGATVVVESVDMPAGGFVAIHEGSASGPVIGYSGFLNSSVTHENVRITLQEPYNEPQSVTLVAMPHKDTNNNNIYEFGAAAPNVNADGPYTDNGSAVIDSASVTVDRGTPTPRVVTVQQPSPTPRVVEETVVVEETRVVEQTRVVEETRIVTVTQGQPGFGIAVAVLALLAAALLAVRRRD